MALDADVYRIEPGPQAGATSAGWISQPGRLSQEWSCWPRTFAELLIHCEEDRTLRAVLVGMLREAER